MDSNLGIAYIADSIYDKFKDGGHQIKFGLNGIKTGSLHSFDRDERWPGGGTLGNPSIPSSTLKILKSYSHKFQKENK